jgi:hypothetical protein
LAIHLVLKLKLINTGGRRQETLSKDQLAEFELFAGTLSKVRIVGSFYMTEKIARAVEKRHSHFLSHTGRVRFKNLVDKFYSLTLFQ